MNPPEYRHVHFIGVGGVGLSRLAKYFLFQKKVVSGSDLLANEFTEQLAKLGLDFKVGHAAENVPKECDLVVFSSAIPETCPELIEAKKRGILILSHFELLGKITQAFKTIAVSGTNGKSTTTTLLGLIMEAAGLDPTVFVGTAVGAWYGNLRVGRGRYLVVEADELKRQFLSLMPFGLVITNVEADHLDYFTDLQDIYKAFGELIAKVPENGFLVYNKDDIGAAAVMKEVSHPRIASFGRASGTVKLLNIKTSKMKVEVEINLRGKKSQFSLQVPGLFNVYNALAAIAAAADLDIPFSVMKPVLESFKGTWRRFQILGTYKNSLVINDYGHHPTALLETVVGAREFFPGKRILLVFQPHQRARTNFFHKEFIEALKLAAPDGLILSEIYDVAGRDGADSPKISSKDLLIEISKFVSESYYAKNRDEALLLARKLSAEYDIVLVMGAGDIYKLAEALIAEDVLL
ncbi:MAG: UDP-N-acetylmuramate--L-alanine ligase [Patescibacteria group bacterium]|nr:UDP-N-acetylmuramate--L-alanine ligase [Patescibacteria group bacterium]